MNLEQNDAKLQYSGINLIRTRLPSSLRPTTRECVYLVITVIKPLKIDATRLALRVFRHR